MRGLCRDVEKLSTYFGDEPNLQLFEGNTREISTLYEPLKNAAAIVVRVMKCLIKPFLQ